MMSVSTRTVAWTAALAVVVAIETQAQPRRDVPYAGTAPIVVQRMLELARLRPGDVVYDLGCGDGRIVIAAVKTPGVSGVCVEIDPALLRLSRAEAERAGVADRIRFVEGDLFEVPIADATVVTLYLLREVNLRLRPRLLRELRPGTRVISNAFDMGDWEPEQRVVLESPGFTEIYRWTIPAPR
jgi:SAM-dependent methyltransferase